MNKCQKQTIEYIKKEIPNFDFYGSDNEYEIKEFKIDDSNSLGGIISLSFITGYKDNNYFNKYRTCLIGKRGGIKVTVKNKKGNWKNQRVSLFDFMNKYYR